MQRVNWEWVPFAASLSYFTVDGKVDDLDVLP
jgi:hypothetical protein